MPDRISHRDYQRNVTLENGAFWCQGCHVHYRCHQDQYFRQWFRALASLQFVISPAQKLIAERAKGEDVSSHSTASEFAKDPVGDILKGASGLI